MDKRKFQRMSMENVSADVSDGTGSFPGQVSDISRSGIGITDLPKRLNADLKKMTVVVSEKGRYFKMIVKPRWLASEGLTKSLGAEIINVPLGWTEFVMQHEPVFDESVWGEIRL